MARCGATFAAQLIKQVERKLLIVCAERQLEKNLPEPFCVLPPSFPPALQLSTGDRYEDFTAICCSICLAKERGVGVAAAPRSTVYLFEGHVDSIFGTVYRALLSNNEIV